MAIVDELLYAFEQGDLVKMDQLLSDDFNLRIEHYGDDAVHVSWQHSTNRAEFYLLLERLSKEVFSRGTKILSLETQTLQDGWTLSKFKQQFYYEVRKREVLGETWILAHEKGDRLDYFREIATPVINVE